MLEIVISVVAGAIIAFLIAKWQMRRNKIIHYTLNSYDIGKGLSDEFPEFELHYNNRKIGGNLRVLKGGFMNIGRNDISHLEFSLVLPKDCIVKIVKTYPSEDELDVALQNSDEIKNSLVFHINGIFKTDEHFEYTAIIEVPLDTKSLLNELSFQHRILNTEKIKNINILDYNYMIYKQFWYRFYALFYAIVGIAALVAFISTVYKISDMSIWVHIFYACIIAFSVGMFLLAGHFIYKWLFNEKSHIVKVLKRDFREGKYTWSMFFDDIKRMINF